MASSDDGELLEVGGGERGWAPCMPVCIGEWQQQLMKTVAAASL